MNERLILCGGLRAPAGASEGKDIIRLNLWGKDPSVHLKMSDITQKMAANIPPLLVDLLEVASYVYAADQAVTRANSALTLGAGWRKNLEFHIPVRKLEIWSRQDVVECLCETLNFASEHNFVFKFTKADHPPASAPYFDFRSDQDGGFVPEHVMLFSGGLDSLAGAVQEAVMAKKSIALVSHRSSPKLSRSIEELVKDLTEDSLKAGRIFHVPVWVNKSKVFTKEPTQRTRSFLFASLAAVVSRMFGLSGIRFYENGVTSFQLPITEQVIGARASRTTHPQVLSGYARLFSSLFGQPFSVENPFLWKTKTEVVELIAQGGCSHLIKHSSSCSHTWEKTKLKTHCGRCSQCIDRRFGVLAAGREADEPAEIYQLDLLSDARETTEDKTMLESYVRHADRIKGMSDALFFAEFPETARAIGYVNMSTPEAAKAVYDLHKRHAENVDKVVCDSIKRYAKEIHDGSLPDTCLVALAVHDRYKQALSKSKSRIVAKFQTPPGTTWPGIQMKMINGNTVRVTIQGVETKVSYEKMGLEDLKKSAPNKIWQLLETFADGHGVLNWNSHKADRKNQKRKELLAKALKEYFEVPGEPFENTEDGGWKANFEIEPVS